MIRRSSKFVSNLVLIRKLKLPIWQVQNYSDLAQKATVQARRRPFTPESSSFDGPPETPGSNNDGGSENSDLQVIQPRAPFSPVLALPISRRPLFPGFYKTVVIKDAAVIRAVKAAIAEKQPYVAAVLLKNEDADTDIITSIDDIHRVGVFCEISHAFSSGPSSPTDDGSLTVVLYPIQRIKVSGLIKTDIKNVSESNVTSEEGEKTLQQIKASPQYFLLRPYHKNRQKQSKIIDFGHSALVISDPLTEEKYKPNNPLLRALANEIVSVIKDIAALNPIFRDQVAAFSISPAASTIFDDPKRLADFAAAVSGGSDAQELQEVLDSLVVEERLQKALLVIKKELVNAQLQAKLSKDIESKIQKRQREYYLSEQLRAIRKELGLDSAGDGGRDRLIETYKKRIQELGGSQALPSAVSSVIEDEIQKLSNIDPSSSEFNVARNYLDWLTCLPWTKTTREHFDIKSAKNTLDNDHYGLKDVKERILEFIAVNRMRGGSVQGKIICLSGPPGVGKTSIGKSIARALGRTFYRFSVGGLTDVAEIKGHRRTYVGAMPGKIVQALKKVQSSNPLILIDEIDKLGRYASGGSSGGDPASALLELLDPEQNNSFLDHYLDLPLDLSRVLFVCTANNVETIPGPLLDRMEVIPLSGYVAEEKMSIAEQYLVPQALKSCGLSDLPVSIENSALDNLIRYYCRESGVRSLKKHIEKISRKVAYKIINNSENNVSQSISSPEIVVGEQFNQNVRPQGLENMEPILITKESLKDYVGSPPFSSERLFKDPPAGVITGLAWTSLGGATLYIESIYDGAFIQNDQKKPNSSVLQRTGQLGSVMNESSTIAHTFAKSFLRKINPQFADILDSAKIHLHVPCGATPKDGPSAGITMATSIISLVTGKKVAGNIAMTGELTLSGLVLKIGGLKEKIIAAKRSGIDTIIFPKENESDWNELPDYIKKDVEPVLVESFDQVYKTCFKD